MLNVYEISLKFSILLLNEKKVFSVVKLFSHVLFFISVLLI